MRSNKYEPLGKHLIHNGQQNITLKFNEINKILGSMLPPWLGDKDRKKLLWNNNPTLYATRSWLEAGYLCTGYNREQEVVSFQKI